MSSLILYPEARAALGRARRLGRLDDRALAATRRRVEALWTALDRIDLTPEIAQRAGVLAELCGLRAYDSVHLASLEHAGDADTMLVSADEELLDAAQSLGFSTMRPRR